MYIYTYIYMYIYMYEEQQLLARSLAHTFLRACAGFSVDVSWLIIVEMHGE